MSRKNRRTCLVLHKQEWNRLHRNQNSASLSEHELKKKDEIQRLNKISKEWMKSWPDSIEGVVEKAEKSKENKRKKQIEDYKLYLQIKKNMQDNSDKVQKAKQTIFENTCYGKQLTSALLESKAYEEIDLQVDLKKKLKKENEEIAKKIGCCNSLDFHKDEEKEKKDRILKNKEIEAVNKAMHATKLCKDKEESRRNKEYEADEALMTKKLLENEARKMDDCKTLAKEEVKQFQEEKQKMNQRKMLQEENDNKITEALQKKLDQKRFKKQCIINQIHKNGSKSVQNEKHYELIKKLNEEQNKAYNDFIEKGTEKMEKELLLKDETDKTKKREVFENNKKFAQANKKAGEEEKLRRIENKKCDYGTEGLLLPSQRCVKTKVIEKEENPELSFLKKINKSALEAEKRGHPSDWTGTEGAHKQFAQNATETLKQCKYKHTARKVVDAYRNTNRVDESTLPVSNYY